MILPILLIFKISCLLSTRNKMKRILDYLLHYKAPLNNISYLDLSFYLDPLQSHQPFLDSMKNAEFFRVFTEDLLFQTEDPFIILKRLTVIHFLVFKNHQHINLLEKFVESPFVSKDEWMNHHFIQKYYRFLRKIVAGENLYKMIQRNEVQLNLEVAFELINLIQDLCKMGEKISTLGRYFNRKYKEVTCSFVEMLAIESQKIYTATKKCIFELLQNTGHYIKKKQQEVLLKIILQQCIPSINENLIKIFLDKIFYPYGRGIGIKLFRIQDQPADTRTYIRKIINDHRDTQRHQAQVDLQKTLFPEQGQMNLHFLQMSLSSKANSFAATEDLNDFTLSFDLSSNTKSKRLDKKISMFQRSTEETKYYESSKNFEICLDI